MTRREIEPDMPEIAVDKVCFVVAKAPNCSPSTRAKPWMRPNPADDRDRAALTNAAVAPTVANSSEFAAALDADEQNALVALAWIGRAISSLRTGARGGENAGRRETRPPDTCSAFRSCPTISRTPCRLSTVLRRFRTRGQALDYQPSISSRSISSSSQRSSAAARSLDLRQRGGGLF